MTRRPHYPQSPLFDHLPLKIRNKYQCIAVKGQGKWTDVYIVQARGSGLRGASREGLSPMLNEAEDDTGASSPSPSAGEERVVVRCIDSCRMFKDEIDISLLREILRGEMRLTHKNVIQLFDWAMNDRYFCVVSEGCWGGSVSDRLDLYEDFCYPERDASIVARQLLEGLAYLHQEGVLHRNICTSQLMFKTSNSLENLKITDFEHAVWVGRGVDSAYGEVRWRGIQLFRQWPIHWGGGNPYVVAPETLRQYEWRRASDMWGTGIAVYEMLFGAVPFFGRSKRELGNAIEASEPDIQPFEVSPQCADFLRKLLSKSPTDRPTAEEALKHPWIQDGEKCASEWLKGGGREKASIYSSIPSISTEF